MIALLRKDGPWLSGCLLAGAITLAIVLGQEGFVQAWVLPPWRLEGLFHAGWICGAVLGLLAGLWDELLGTRDYLAHRPVARHRVHGARVLGVGLVLLGWFTVPVAVVWLQEAVLGQNFDQLQPGNVAEVWASLLPAATAAAIALFAGTLPCAWLLRLGAGAAALLLTFTAVEVWSRASPSTVSMAPFAALHVGAAALFTLASFAGAGRAADADRPWPARSLFGGTSLALLAFTLLGAMSLGAVQCELLGSLHLVYPNLFAVDGGLQLAVRDHRDGRWQLLPVDGDHRVTGPPMSRERPGEAVPDWFTFGAMQPGFDAPPFHRPRGMSAYRSTRLYEDGRAFLVRDEGYTGRVSVIVTGKGPQRERFAPDAEAVDPRGEPRSTWIFERSTRTLWRLDEQQQWFVPVALPDGDRLRAVHANIRPEEEGRKQLEVGDLVYQLRSDDRVAVVGERGVYQLRGDAIVAAPEWMQDEAGKRQRPRPWQAERVDADLMSPRLVVRDADGAQRFEHQYAPRTFAERAHAALLLGLSLLRPPGLQVPAHLFAAPGAQRDPLLDPLLAGGRRPWLLLGCLLVAAAAAFAAARRLRALGAGPPRRGFWIAACALLGPMILLALLLVERRRAWTPAAALGVPAALPRIASAVSA